jgi:hypothetical protein
MNISAQQEKDLLATLDARTTALIQGNKAVLADLFIDSFIYSNAHGRVFDKATYLDLFVGSPDLVWQSQEASDVKILVYDNVAIISCMVHDNASYKGDAFDAYFRSTHTLLNNDGKWKFVASHTSPIVEFEE